MRPTRLLLYYSNPATLQPLLVNRHAPRYRAPERADAAPLPTLQGKRQGQCQPRLDNVIYPGAVVGQQGMCRQVRWQAAVMAGGGCFVAWPKEGIWLPNCPIAPYSSHHMISSCRGSRGQRKGMCWRARAHRCKLKCQHPQSALNDHMCLQPAACSQRCTAVQRHHITWVSRLRVRCTRIMYPAMLHTLSRARDRPTASLQPRPSSPKAVPPSPRMTSAEPAAITRLELAQAQAARRQLWPVGSSGCTSRLHQHGGLPLNPSVPTQEQERQRAPQARRQLHSIDGLAQERHKQRRQEEQLRHGKSRAGDSRRAGTGGGPHRYDAPALLRHA